MTLLFCLSSIKILKPLDHRFHIYNVPLTYRTDYTMTSATPTSTTILMLFNTRPSHVPYDCGMIFLIANSFSMITTYFARISSSISLRNLSWSIFCHVFCKHTSFFFCKFYFIGKVMPLFLNFILLKFFD